MAKTPLSEKDLLRLHVWWPRNLSEPEIRGLLRTITRFIDFDCTIAGGGGAFIHATLCGAPTAEFLAQEPYILQTWNPSAAEHCFTIEFPRLPKPTLIVVPPMIPLAIPNDEYNHAKDFDALGVTGKIIIDDMPAQCIKATDCILVHPSKPLPPQTPNA